jgi:hypothetical protein
VQIATEWGHDEMLAITFRDAAPVHELEGPLSALCNQLRKDVELMDLDRKVVRKDPAGKECAQNPRVVVLKIDLHRVRLAVAFDKFRY